MNLIPSVPAPCRLSFSVELEERDIFVPENFAARRVKKCAVGMVMAERELGFEVRDPSKVVGGVGHEAGLSTLVAVNGVGEYGLEK